MIGILLILVVLFLIFKPKNNNQDMPTSFNDQVFKDYDKTWINFIKSYFKVTKTKSEKALLEKMLSDLESQGYDTGASQPRVMSEASENAQLTQGKQYSTVEQPKYIDQKGGAQQKTKQQIQLDNASLLLYFGAFLLVASAGLFVGFGGLNGAARTCIVLLVALLLYAGGIAIYISKPKLKQAGLAFVGIGMSIAPLTGLAAYSYIFDKQNGAVVWLATSTLCLALYTHALLKLRNPLLNYILIFTFVSLFESSIAVVELPLYYFGWGLAAIGLLLSLVARSSDVWDDMRQSSAYSGMLFLPLALLCSAALLVKDGPLQLGVSLTLAAAYYALQAYDTNDEERLLNAAIAHVSLLGAVVAISFGLSASWPATALALGACSILQFAVVLFAKTITELIQNFTSVMVAGSILSTIIAMSSRPTTLLLAVIALVVSLGASLKQKQKDLYVIAAAESLLLPVIFALYYKQPALPAVLTVVLVAVASAFQLVCLTLAKKTFSYVMKGTAQYAYLVSSCCVIAGTFFTNSWMTFYVAIYTAATYVLLGYLKVGDDWEGSAGIIVCMPLLWGTDHPGMFLITTILALAINIVISLGKRSEFNRWISTLLWLLLPVSMGKLLGWTLVEYAWAYFVAMLGLVLSRSIARGVVFVSSKIPLASYAANSSNSYEFGYWLAAISSVSLSIASQQIQLHTTLLLLGLVPVVLVIGRYVEKRHDVYILLPFLIQAALFAGIYPGNDNALQLFISLSTILSVVFYILGSAVYNKQDKEYPLQTGALFTVWIAPMSVWFVGRSLVVMPIGLLVASLLYVYHLRSAQQSQKEFAWSGVAASLAWLLYLAKVTEPQAYVHILIALLAGFAYWRNTRAEQQQSDQYVYAMLITATLPLTLQALQSQSGGVYGWWLLLEQIGFIVLGMSIGKKFVTSWGLYATVAAVLYQLRDLGWAALSVLALFLIGLAVYKIQKNSDK